MGLCPRGSGYRRATMDLDFLVHPDDFEKVHESLTALGYERLITGIL